MERYVFNTQHTSYRVIDGEAVLINTDTSVYYSINLPGTHILKELIGKSKTTAEVAAALSTTYPGSKDNVDADTPRFVRQLMDEGLILQRSGDQAADGFMGSDETRLPREYEPPSLERHGELEKLILSGE